MKLYKIKHVMEVTSEVEARNKSEAMKKFESDPCGGKEVTYDVGLLHSWYEESTLSLSENYKDKSLDELWDDALQENDC